jgi:hypothetical protein
MLRGARAVVEWTGIFAKHSGHLKTLHNSHDALLAAATGGSLTRD